LTQVTQKKSNKVNFFVIYTKRLFHFQFQHGVTVSKKQVYEQITPLSYI